MPRETTSHSYIMYLIISLDEMRVWVGMCKAGEATHGNSWLWL